LATSRTNGLRNPIEDEYTEVAFRDLVELYSKVDGDENSLGQLEQVE
jgi:hypothetical protein